MSMGRTNKEYLARYRKAMFSQYWGSMSTTSEGVTNKFDSIISDYATSNDENEMRVLVFDEVGLAELAPDNPLKVIHSYLDPSSEDTSTELLNLIKEKSEKNEGFKDKTLEEKENFYQKISKKHISFVGISNWDLDVSKANRMLYVARPKMSEEDLIKTSEK